MLFVIGFFLGFLVASLMVTVKKSDEKAQRIFAEHILKKYGWNEFVKYCTVNELEDLKFKHTPCEADDGQCHMDCYMRGECHEMARYDWSNF